MHDFLFRGSLGVLDPAVVELTELEAERQVRKLILVPSESAAPAAVRQALGSEFQNIYAEGYPDEDTRWMTEPEILDYGTRLGHFHRYSDPRYYKGTEYADAVEALARRRTAETFAANGVTADDLYVNVQALSGAPANNAVYQALAELGDVVMGMDLLHGGHLTHGSPVNRSGKYYKIVHYSVDPHTEMIDYEAVAELARQNKPKFIIAGYTSYPWIADWARFHAIAKEVGAYLMADISHVAGLVAAGVYPSPVGYADIITFTTHKTLCGPRGACILTTSPILARKIDRAVFPGEQGGPHVHVFAAMAVTMKLAQTDQFRQLQSQIIKNCLTLTERLQERGFRIPYGGTNTHLMNLDCKSIVGSDGTTLSGDQAVRLLDIAGLVTNRNTIPGDKSALNPSGIRMGTPWVTQRGLKEAEMVEIADIIADLLKATTPYTLEVRKGDLSRAKVDFLVLENAKLRVRNLAEKAGIDSTPTPHGYPHFYYLDSYQGQVGSLSFDLSGVSIRSVLNFAFSSDVESLQPGQSQVTRLVTSQGEVDGTLACVSPYEFHLSVPADKAGLAAAWLRELSDGYVAFDDDPLRKLAGPFIVRETPVPNDKKATGNPVAIHKPYFIGISSIQEPIAAESHPESLPIFKWEEKESGLRRTPIYEVHKQAGAKIIPFAGWEMPVWYTSVIEEHLAVRQAAGLFDVAHMGVYQAEGRDAAVFLDSVVGNDIESLQVGESLYTHFLDMEANVIDDLLVYRRGLEKYLVVVNASNDDKDWAWLNAVKDGKVCIDTARPWAYAFGRNVTLRNLRDPKEGADMRVDIALQGPRAREVLLALGCDPETRRRITALARTQLCEAVVGDFDLVVSRTGYTGEKMAFELFVHPERSAEFFSALLKVGEPFGLKPCGLGARDSLRTEAGLPLYGHEMGLGSGHSAGKDPTTDLGVAEGGFGTYVKTFKPWFIGRSAFLAREKKRKGVVVRFRFNEKGIRMAHKNDPVLDKRGRVIGWVTSCAVDSDGFLTGLAFLEQKSTEEGTPLFIFQGAPAQVAKAPFELAPGDRTTLPNAATVVSRFPKL